MPELRAPRSLLCALALWVCAACAAHAPALRAPQTDALLRSGDADKPIAALLDELRTGRLKTRELVELYRSRVDHIDRQGPELHAVLALNPQASDDATQRDQALATGHVIGPLHGLPILLKDNIESAGPLPTTAGSLALTRNVSGQDAPLVARLRGAGAVVLGKANLSEWANIRSSYSSSGWSAVGGLTKNPFALDRNTCGSSSGSAVAVAANLAAAAIGTETDGSITCPASVLGLVGFKPTLGAVPRTGIIPISSAQDTAGPIVRYVQDAALLMNVLAGPDDSDADSLKRKPIDHLAHLKPDALQGRRFGVLQFLAGFLPQVDALFATALRDIEAAGASLVVIAEAPDLEALNERELSVLLHDFRRELNAYLAHAPPAVEVRSLTELIQWNRAHAPQELPYFGQDLFLAAEQTADADHEQALRVRDDNRRLAADTIDGWMSAHNLDALLAPTVGPAWTTDLVNGDHVLGGASSLPAVAGYPHLTVPMGQVSGLPVGLSFIGAADEDAELLGYGYAYEQKTRRRKAPALASGP